jgi:hypothetical protein
VLYREAERAEEVIIPNLLPQDAFLGARPPVVADYLDDNVSAIVNLPATRKVVVVNAIEVSTLG